MNIYDDLLKLRDCHGLLSEESMKALGDFFVGYDYAFAACRQRIDEGNPPFRLFSGWLLRRFGKQIVSPSGYTHSSTPKSCFMIIAEEFANPDAAYQNFFLLLDEFRSLRPHVLSTVVISDADRARLSDSFPGLIQFVATQYMPEPGVYLSVDYESVRPFDVGHFQTFNDVARYAEAAYKFDRKAWSIPDAANQTAAH